jgi:hypothetical protein
MQQTRTKMLDFSRAAVTVGDIFHHLDGFFSSKRSSFATRIHHRSFGALHHGKETSLASVTSFLTQTCRLAAATSQSKSSPKSFRV